MPSGRFAPPRSDVGTGVESTTDVDLRKPWGVWLMQALAAGLAALSLSAIAWLTRSVALGQATVGWAGVAQIYAVDGVGLALSVGTLVGSQRRRRWALWTGIALMTLLFAAGAAIADLAAFTDGVFRLDPDSGDLELLLVAVAIMATALGVSAAFGLPARSRAWLRGRG